MKYAVVFLVVTIASASFANEFVDHPVRQWTDNTGTFTMRGSLVRVNEPQQVVVLKLQNERQQVEVPLRRLSRFDRDYLDLIKRRAALNKPAPVVSVAGKNKANSKPEHPQGQSSNASKVETDDVTKLNGITWFNSLDEAKQQAAGKLNSPFDDKPILCFRVLGELEGFM